MLAEQQAQQRSITNNRNEMERRQLSEINRKNTEALEKEKQDKQNYRLKLQQINRERT